MFVCVMQSLILVKKMIIMSPILVSLSQGVPTALTDGWCNSNTAVQCSSDESETCGFTDQDYMYRASSSSPYISYGAAVSLIMITQEVSPAPMDVSFNVSYDEETKVNFKIIFNS